MVEETRSVSITSTATNTDLFNPASDRVCKILSLIVSNRTATIANFEIQDIDTTGTWGTDYVFGARIPANDTKVFDENVLGKGILCKDGVTCQVGQSMHVTIRVNHY